MSKLSVKFGDKYELHAEGDDAAVSETFREFIEATIAPKQATQLQLDAAAALFEPKRRRKKVKTQS